MCKADICCICLHSVCSFCSWVTALAYLWCTTPPSPGGSKIWMRLTTSLLIPLPCTHLEEHCWLVSWPISLLFPASSPSCSRVIRDSLMRFSPGVLVKLLGKGSHFHLKIILLINIIVDLNKYFLCQPQEQ